MTERTVSPGQEWRPCRYAPGDEVAILALFRNVFGSEKSPAHWKWQFAESPYGPPLAVLARSTVDDRVVGQQALMLAPLNVKGSRVQAAHSLDLAVDERHRGQRIFEHTALDAAQWAAQRGVTFLFAFPNASSYPGFVRTLGWHRILFPLLYTSRVGARVLPGPLGRIPLLASVLDLFVRSGTRIGLGLRRSSERELDDIRTFSNVPDDADALWNRCRSQEVLSLWKDRTYLAWRYDRNPNHEFRYVCLQRAGTTRALAVTVRLGSTLMICELLVPGREIAAGRRLVDAIREAAVTEGADKVQFFGRDAGFFDEVLRGFSRRIAFENVLVGRALDDAELDTLSRIPDNWTVTYGDADFV